MTHTTLAPAVRRWFEELVELPEAERGAHVARLRAEDPRLAERVESLLAASDAAPEFLDGAAEASELLGHRAGPWRIAERLSAGGGGAVYRALRVDGEVDGEPG